MTASRILLILLRALVAVQLILGIAMWTGYGSGLLSVHRASGMLFVLVLWILAIMSLAGRRHIGWSLFAIAWGLVIAAVGFMQVGIMPGDYHWIIKVIHLIIGLAAMPLAEHLVKGQVVT
jgi:hypothetical protein